MSGSVVTWKESRAFPPSSWMSWIHGCVNAWKSPWMNDTGYWTDHECLPKNQKKRKKEKKKKEVPKVGGHAYSVQRHRRALLTRTWTRRLPTSLPTELDRRLDQLDQNLACRMVTPSSVRRLATVSNHDGVSDMRNAACAKRLCNILVRGNSFVIPKIIS